MSPRRFENINSRGSHRRTLMHRGKRGRARTRTRVPAPRFSFVKLDDTISRRTTVTLARVRGAHARKEGSLS